MTTTKDQPPVLLEEQPTGKQWVRVVGRTCFLKTGYLIWHPGLTLSSLEKEIGCNRGYSLPIVVAIARNHRTIYEKRATEWPLHAAPNSGPIIPKSDAPDLKPGDVVSAGPPIDF